MKDAQKRAKEDQKRIEEIAKSKEAKDKEAKEANSGKANKNKKEKEKDPDPNGEKLASVANPLEEASKLLQVLREYHENSLQTQILGFEVRKLGVWKNRIT